jgi:hypothetical protein
MYSLIINLDIKTFHSTNNTNYEYTSIRVFLDFITIALKKHFYFQSRDPLHLMAQLGTR